jgi:DNA-binding winged helix-turn-helix (wHTH) protein/TolB-like protein/Tfp pilus assembly protein PilF
MSTNPGHFYEFGTFRVDESERLLLRGEDVVPLTPKAFEMLLVLLESSGHVLTKEDLMKRVWPDSFVEEANLSHNIYKLREALGEGSDGEKYIETLPRRGYRFVAKVTEVQGERDDLIIEEQSRAHIVVEEDDAPEKIIETQIAPAEQRLALPAHAERPALRKQLIAIGGCVGLIGLVFAVIYFFNGRESPAVSGAPLRSIAVLPFKPLVANDRDESLEMGMADTLITRLSHIGQLSVRPTSAVRQYTKLEDEAVKAGRELMVDAVLDGSIQKSGDRVRVSVRLVRIDQGHTVWTEQFDEKLTDIFTVQDAISRRVGDSLALRLSAEEKSLLAKRYTESTEAYQLYLRGRYHWNRRTPEGISKAVEYFNQAIQSDPSYAQAYAGLADSYSLLPEIANAPFQESMTKAKAASLKALDIDNTLAEAHVSLAYVKYCEWDSAGIEDEYRRGLALNPNYATGHQWYSEYLVHAGRTDDALKEIKLAQQLDPLSLIINTRIGMTLYYSRRYEEAIEQLRKTLEFDPDFILTHIFLYASFFEKGMHREAIPHLVKGFFHVYSSEERERIEAALTAAFEASGEKGLWEKVRDLLKSAEKRDFNYPYSMAETYMRLGDKDQAFLWLQKATDVRHPGVGALKVAPVMDGLRTDLRYAELLRRMNL